MNPTFSRAFITYAAQFLLTSASSYKTSRVTESTPNSLHPASNASLALASSYPRTTVPEIFLKSSPSAFAVVDFVTIPSSGEEPSLSTDEHNSSVLIAYAIALRILLLAKASLWKLSDKYQE